MPGMGLVKHGGALARVGGHGRSLARVGGGSQLANAARKNFNWKRAAMIGGAVGGAYGVGAMSRNTGPGADRTVGRPTGMYRY